jgi:pyruvate,water dikinase
MSSFVLGFQDIDKTKLMVAGGKGANLGELSKVEGIRVPEGFCISAEAFKRIIGETPLMNELLDQLSLLKVEDRDKIGELSGEIRRAIEGIAIPEDIQEEIIGFLSKLGDKNAYAVRSSATAEDLPTASFAGQHDTYLNIIGKTAILKHISKCWASLFTERAVKRTVFKTVSITVKSNCLSLCRRWSSRRHQEFCLLPIPSLPIGKCCPLMPAMALVRPWSPAW